MSCICWELENWQILTGESDLGSYSCCCWICTWASNGITPGYSPFLNVSFGCLWTPSFGWLNRCHVTPVTTLDLCNVSYCYTSWPISIPKNTNVHWDVCPQREVCRNDVKLLKHLLSSLDIRSDSSMEKWLDRLFSDKHSLWTWHSTFIPLTTHLQKKLFSVWWHIEARSFAKQKELEESFHFE